MSKKITIVTAFPISIPHPRVETEKKILAESGYEVKVLSFPQRPDSWQRMVNYTAVNYFKKHLYSQILESLGNEDIVILYDFHLLPLVKKIRKMNIQVIYESIDNMVHLNYHFLLKSFPPIRPFGNLILARYASMERKLAAKANAVIVNSKALVQYFQPVQANLIYYCSPFEKEPALHAFPSPAALLYLGLFSDDKGAQETLALQSSLDLPLFVVGDIKEDELKKKVQSTPNVYWEPRQSPEMLGKNLSKLRSKYRLLGCSIIQPIHYSYATQEANKDQDYMAMGIPIIGNTRGPTFEKIEAGCGVLYTEPDKIRELIENEQIYTKISETCLEYYQENYAYEIFRDSLLRLVRQISGQTT